MQLGPNPELDEPGEMHWTCLDTGSGFLPAWCHGGNIQPFTHLSPASDILGEQLLGQGQTRQVFTHFLREVSGWL